MKMTGMTGVRSFSFASAMTPVWVSQRAPVGTMELRVWVPQGRQNPLFGVLTEKGRHGRERGLASNLPTLFRDRPVTGSPEEFRPGARA